MSAGAIFAISGMCSWAIGWMGDFDFPWLVIVALAMAYGFAIAADSAIYTTAITEVADPSNLGSTLALQSFVGFSGGVAGPIVFGGILDVSPESIKWGMGFSSLGLIAALAVAAMLWLHLGQRFTRPARDRIEPS